MKISFIFSFLIFVTVGVQAIELPNFRGAYHFNESELQLQQIQHQVRLVASSSAGQELLQSYRQQNYACVYMGSSAYQCKTFLKNLLDNSEVREEVTSKFKDVVFEFTNSQDEYALVNEGEIIQEFEKYQKSSFAGQHFEQIHFYITPGLKKFKLFSASGAAEHFYLSSNEEIAKQVQLSRVNKKSSAAVVEDKYTYLYEGIWKQ